MLEAVFDDELEFQVCLGGAINNVQKEKPTENGWLFVCAGLLCELADISKLRARMSACALNSSPLSLAIGRKGFL